MSDDVTASDVNLRLLIAASFVITWFAVRDNVWGSPGDISVPLEWMGLIAVTVGLMVAKTRAPRKLGVPIAVTLCVLISASIANRQTSAAQESGYTEYWWGFGGRVMVAALLVALLALLVTQYGARFSLLGDGQVIALANWLKKLISLGVVGWSLPSVLQPMDGWLNLGDATEKVLDELTGWTVGNVPGVHTVWGYNSLLGMPLAPLALLDEPRDSKVIIVTLYANVLVVALPALMSIVISRVFPGIGRIPAFAVALMAVSISGSPGNSSLFQELSFLARGLLPVALGALAVHLFILGAPVRRLHALVFGMLAGASLMNNYEYGVGASLAAIAVAFYARPSKPLELRSIRYLFAGLAVVVFAVLLSSLAAGGSWWNRRLGAWSDILAGNWSLQRHRNEFWPPALGLPALCFAMGVTGVSIGIRSLRATPGSTSHRAAAVSCLFFGVWVVMSSPYFLNSGTDGSFRVQFLFIPFVLLAFSILGLIRGRFAYSGAVRVESRGRPAELLSLLPAVLLCSLALVAILQVPNGLMEWQRLQTPNLNGKTEDEWSPRRLDWIHTSATVRLADEVGGVEAVGWWFSYGNAVEAVTGIENLLGVSVFEGIRSPLQLSLACEPLRESKKSFVISLDGMAERLRTCGFPSVRALTPPNEDGLVVYEVARG